MGLTFKMLLRVASAIFFFAGMATLKGAGRDAQWLGVLWTKGGVLVGNAKVSSGTTVLPGDVITTAQEASAWLRFRSPASTILLANTQVELLASSSAPSLLLLRGTVVVDEEVADPVQVAVPGGYVLVKGGPQTGAECELASLGNAATVSVKRGLAEIHALGNPVILHPGQSARVEAGPQGAQPVAGRIDKEIPHEVIQRQGQNQQIPLKLNDVVNWNDLVRTLQAGRVEIMLLDGSTLNVGARSTIKILKHDPQTQQTEIEMPSGEVLANAQKITAPGGKFQLRTNSAVIRTVDTSFVARVDSQGTTVCDVSGITTVEGSASNATPVSLHPGQCTFVPLGGEPTAPVLNPSLLASLEAATATGSSGTISGLSTGAEIALILGLGGGITAATLGVVLATSGTTSPTKP